MKNFSMIKMPKHTVLLRLQSKLQNEPDHRNGSAVYKQREERAESGDGHSMEEKKVLAALNHLSNHVKNQFSEPKFIT